MNRGQNSGLHIGAGFSIREGRIDISDADVAISDSAVRDLGLRFIGTGVTLMRGPDDVPPGSDLIVATSNADELRNWFERMDVRVAGVVTDVAGPGMSALIALSRAKPMTLTTVVVDDNLVWFTLRPSVEADMDGQYVTTVLQSWFRERAQQLEQKKGEPGPDAMRLQALLQVLDELTPTPQVPKETEPQQGREDSSEALVRLRREYDALKRKYDSLSRSRLGAFTLRYWEIRKKRSVGRG